MKLIFLAIFVTTVMASDTDGGQGYATSFSTGNGKGYGYGGSFGSGGYGGGGFSSSDQGSPGHAGSSGSGTSFSGGYGGGFNSGGQGSNGYGGTFGSGSSGHGLGSFAPIPQFDFNSLLSDYFDIFKKLNQGLAATNMSAYSYSFTNTDPNSKAQAQSSLTFDAKGLQNQQNAFAAGGYGYPGGYPAYSGGGIGGGFSGVGGQGAAASASIGPGGVHQTASVYPQNPNVPNVNTRFGAPAGSGSYGVFTSSHSVSSNVDGKPTTYQQASTTINDNGKVSTYTVHNP